MVGEAVGEKDGLKVGEAVGAVGEVVGTWLGELVTGAAEGIGGRSNLPVTSENKRTSPNSRRLIGNAPSVT